MIASDPVVDINKTQFDKRREEADLDARKRAELEYTKHVEGIHHREKRCRPPVDEEEYAADEVIVQNTEYEEYEGTVTQSTKRPRTFGKDVDANWYVEATPEGKATWVPVLYPWQKSMNSLAGAEDESRQEDCFGCAFLSVDAHENIYIEDWRCVVEYYQTALLQFPAARQLGQELYRVFDRTVQAALRKNDELGEDETLWTPYGILEHFTKHNNDPVVQHIRHHMALTEARDIIINNELIEENVESGRRRVGDKALKKFETVVGMLERLAKVNPYLLPFASKEVAKTSTDKPLFLNSRSQLKHRPNFAEVQSMWNR